MHSQSNFEEVCKIFGARVWGALLREFIRKAPNAKNDKFLQETTMIFAISMFSTKVRKKVNFG